ncbi:MMS19 nucleotide excision repair protein [Abortiporus biennis]
MSISPEAEERVERLVRTWMSTGRNEEVDLTVSELSDVGSLLSVVKALGEFLTSEEDEPRTKGVEFLSLVLGRFPPEKLSRQSVRVLVTFFRGKLEDTETIVPALEGLATLVTLPNFASSDAIDIIQSLFKHVKMRALVQSVRFTVFTIVDGLIAKHRDALKGLGKDFLTGYIALAEGEKDPRNLLLAFAIARVLLIEFDVTDHVEDLFNITFCYFPITFRPPPDDPYRITTEDLKSTLRGCLNATPLFGPLAIPLFLEKLTAGTPNTKKDTLQTLDECLPIYGASVARANARKLWNTLKLEIFQPTNSDIEAEALKTTQVLIQTIYSDKDSSAEATGEEIEGLAREACDECIKILKEPEKSQAKPATKILCAFMSTTPSVAKFTLSQAVPHLVKLFLNPDEAPNRAPTLRLLSDIIIAARDSTLHNADALPDEVVVPLSAFKDEVLGVLTVGLKATSTSRPALDGLKGMVTTQGLLTDEEVGFVVHNVNELLSEDEDEDVSEAILDLLTSISVTAPRHISQTTLPLLFTSLPDRAPPRSAENERHKYWRTLAFLKRLCVQSDLFEMLVVRLTTKLDLIFSPTPLSSEEETDEQVDDEPSAAYAHSILRTLADVLKIKVDKGDVDAQKYIDRLLPRLYHLHNFASLSTIERDWLAADARLVNVTAEIVTLIMQVQTVQKQEIFLSSLFAAFIDGEAKKVAEGLRKLPEGKLFLPFDTSANSRQKNLIILFTSPIIALYKEVKLPTPDEDAFLDKLLLWGIFVANTNSEREAAFQAIASVINKRTSSFSEFLSNLLEKFWISTAGNRSTAVERRKKVINAWTWITKALLIQNHALTQKFVDKLFELFDDPTVSWDAARSIGKVVASDKVLTKRHHATIKILHAQRFFNSVLPRIVQGAKDSEDPQKQNAYLVALTSLIKSIPKTTYTHELPSLMPLLLRGLDLPDAEIRANVIDTFLATADPASKENTESMVSEHASSLVSTMLKNCMVEEMPSVRLRISALRYLAVLPSLVRYDLLHPQKAIVIRELAKVLDDPKRAVRKEAVEARTNWFKYTG